MAVFFECTTAYYITLPACAEEITVNLNLLPLTQYDYRIRTSFGKMYQKTITTDENGSFVINQDDFPADLWNPWIGKFTLNIYQGDECAPETFTICDNQYDTIVFEFSEWDSAEAVIGTVEPQEPVGLYFQTGSNGSPAAWDAANPNQRGMLYIPAVVSQSAILYLHGNGENGTDIALLNSAGLPKLLDNGQQQKSLVFAPQKSAGMVWSVTTVQKAIDYMQVNYPIQTVYIYGTGVSAGALGIIDYIIGGTEPLNGAFVGGVPTAGNNINANASTFTDFPLQIVAGMNDALGNIATPTGNIDAILATNPVLPPLIRTVYGGVHNDSTWNTYGFNKETAGFDFEEWLLLHGNTFAETAENYVVLAAEQQTIVSYLQAKRLVDAMTESPEKEALLASLSIIFTGFNLNSRIIGVDLGLPGATGYGFNKVTSYNNGTSTPPFTTLTNTTTGISLAFVYSQWIDNTVASPDGLYFGLPGYQDGFKVYGDPAAGQTNIWRWTGLDNTKTYELLIFYSHKSVINTSRLGFTLIIGNDVKQSVEDCYNTTRYIQFEGLKPVSGVLEMQMFSTWGVEGNINTMILLEK